MRLASLVFCVAAVAAVPTGPGVGTTVPAFRLQDQNGAWQTLESIMGPKGSMIVFYRSADW